jgi:hypothetical protein
MGRAKNKKMGGGQTSRFIRLAYAANPTGRSTYAAAPGRFS